MDTSLKKITDKIKSDKLRVTLALLCALFLTLSFCIGPFLSRAQNLSGVVEGNTPLDKANKCRDSVYSDLCTLGTIYLYNCTDNHYRGNGALYESLYDNLNYFSIDDEVDYSLFDEISSEKKLMKITHSDYDITSIDNDYFYFYVKYEDSYLTNIPDISNPKYEASTIDELKSRFKDQYYYRIHNRITSNAPYEEKGGRKTEVYYSVSNGGIKTTFTSEYIDSDQLLFGSAGYDNYGRYIYCFDSDGDKIAYNCDVFDESTSIQYAELNDYGSLVIEEEVYNQKAEAYEFRSRTIQNSDSDYLSYVNSVSLKNQNGESISINEIPDYKYSSIDTNELTVFMAPKFNLFNSYWDNVNKYILQYKILGPSLFICRFLSAAMAIAFIAASITKKRQTAELSERTFLDRIFKLDSSIIILLLCIFVIGDIIMNVPQSRDLTYYIIGVIIAKAAAVFIFSLVSAYSVYCIISNLKDYPNNNEILLVNDLHKLNRKLNKRLMKYQLFSSFEKFSERNSEILATVLYLAANLIAIIIINDFFYFDAELNCILTFITAITLTFIFTRRYRKIVKDLPKLEKQIDEMLVNDELKKSSAVLDEDSKLYKLSSKLSDISEKADETVAKQLQSEKMKIELVTNVSHDLKTPLTSIVSYIDLLDKCELSDEARDYVKILAKKSDKLKDIVSDVFSIAKATSGVDVTITDIDFVILLNQVLADNMDRTDQSGRILKTSIMIQQAPIKADGIKLYRAVQNLLVNALKYSMSNTRIYITLTEENDFYKLVIKNVSETEMKFTAEEIIERFTRGDESRTDGGSGLGLAIAKSFIEACGGTFIIEIDGDIFKASVLFPKNDNLESEGLNLIYSP